MRQCELLGLSRSSLYYERADTPVEDLELMQEIEELHWERPFLGSRQMVQALLRKAGIVVNRKRVQRLMRLMGLEAVYPKPKTSKPGGAAHRVFPYLLRDVLIDRVNHVWSTDITFIPMRKGFCYLVAIMDVFSRRILSWRVSNTLDTRFCIEALVEALERFGPPEIFNSDQGAQFTSNAFTGVLEAAGVRISMDGKGRWLDNVHIERFWRSVKYEEVYLHAYEDVKTARDGIKRYIGYYNTDRSHSSLHDLTPDEVYYRFVVPAGVFPADDSGLALLLKHT